jgi:hypothetical protein
MPRLAVKPLPGSYFLPKAEFVYPQTVNWAAIHAVVRPFYDGRLSKTMRGFPPAQIGTALYQMFHQRHQQLLALRELGWTPADNGLRTYCLPGIAHFNVKLQSCCLRTWCPFCWAREVVNNVYHRVHTALYYDHVDGWSRRVKRLGVLEVTTLDEVSYDHSAKALFGSIKWRRKFLRDTAPEALGSLYISTVEPGEEYWLVSTRLLCLVPENYTGYKRLPAGRGTTVRYHKSPVRKNRLADVVGRVCAYPAGLLVGDPNLVMQVLEARQNSRLLTSYGILRNDKVAVQAAQLRKHDPQEQES